MASAAAPKSYFRNVDLDLYSRRDLAPLVKRFGNKVIVLFIGKTRGKYHAHLEVNRHCTTPDSTIRAFCRLINNLPKPERNLWNTALVRSFSIGVEAEAGSPVTDFRVSQESVTSVSEVGAEIVLTVYASAD